MFMTDDHGVWSVGAYGARGIETPHIDALARTGVRFARAFASTPVCSPSRATWITGCLPSHHGIQDYLAADDSYGPTSRDWLAGLTTWPSVLAGHGYTLGFSGKWHMGLDDQPRPGFTHWATVPGGGGSYRDQTFVCNGNKRVVKSFKTDAVGDFALEFLDQQKPGRPFALMVPFYAPHRPYDVLPDRYRARYDNSKFPDYPDVPLHHALNPAMADMPGKLVSKLGYSTLVTAADANVGRIVQRLEQLGLRDNTLVIFTADQGWNAGHHGVWGKGNGTVPFNMYEESIRVPLIWNHPARLRPSAPAPMVSSYDFFPTLLDYLGLEAKRDPRRLGRSYRGWLDGRPPRSWSNRLLFEYAYVRSLRTENLKYVQRADGWPSEFYDLETDPGETRNLIADPAYRDRRAALERELDSSFSTIGAKPIAEWRSTTRQRLPKEHTIHP